MKIKKDDTVIVITGKDKGKTGKVIRAFPQLDRIIVEGVNVKKFHEKPKRQDAKGRIAEKTFPIHVSNVKKEEGEGAKKPKTRKTKKTA